MRTVITGGAGFLGARLATRLLAAADTADDPVDARRVVVADRPGAALPPALAGGHLDHVEVDLTASPEEVEELVAGADAVVHLASVVSADAEADPERAWQVNVEASRSLLAACARRAAGCRVLVASSVAVFAGSHLASGDETKPRPRSTYGMTKTILELLVNEATRRGAIDGRIARLPTVTVRPGKPNLAASSFASGVFREPLAGVDCVVPVADDVTLVLIGAHTAVAGIDALLRVPAAKLGPDRGVNLPGLCVTVEQMIAACRAVGARRGVRLGSIAVRPDAAIEAIVASWPARWDARQALALGLPADASLESIVERYLDDQVLVDR
ncbi:MAG: NAD-dependent epimerase/dehydratase family protein [Acidimicrobiales bacterium]|nr:NAD-dependent epimerase/dehydratase family protein [Acidimicrobiales bacterium]